jgi:hypothetical protein
MGIGQPALAPLADGCYLNIAPARPELASEACISSEVLPEEIGRAGMAFLKCVLILSSPLGVLVRPSPCQRGHIRRSDV